MNTETIDFVHALVEAFPVLGRLLDEHIEDNFGEVLPHLFIADVARTAVSALSGTTSEVPLGPFDSALIKRLLAFLEDRYISDGPEVQELLAVSFLENLPRPEEQGSEIRNMVGPAMQEQLRVIG